MQPLGNAPDAPRSTPARSPLESAILAVFEAATKPLLLWDVRDKIKARSEFAKLSERDLGLAMATLRDAGLIRYQRSTTDRTGSHGWCLA